MLLILTSNFIKNFNFKTKITPEMSNQITIGATAAGSKTSTINGTIFENWNAGLKDKFNQYSINPTPYTASEPIETIEINKKFLKNSHSYDNEKCKYSKWINEQTYLVSWEFTGKNAFNVEYKFNSEYECKIRADGSAIIKQTYLNQI